MGEVNSDRDLVVLTADTPMTSEVRSAEQLERDAVVDEIRVSFAKVEFPVRITTSFRIIGDPSND